MKQLEIPKYDILKEFNVNINASGSMCPLHWHSFYEVEFIVEGTSVQTINGYSYHQTPGFLSILTPNDFHHFKSDNNCTLKYKKFVFYENFVSHKIIAALKSRKKPCIIQIPKSKQKDFNRYFDLLNEYNTSEQNEISRLVLKSLVETVCAEALMLDKLAHIDTTENANILLTSEKDITLHNITKFIEQNFQFQIKLQDVARVAFQSEAYFSHYFKSKFGLSFTEYLKQYRLRHAANLLISSNKSISEICEESGFSSMTFFNRSFKNFYSVTPSQFRNQTSK